MNSGSFFRLDLENSKVFEGVTFYEYIDLPDLAAGEENIRYPIRMSISQDRVSFFVHYFDDSGQYLLRHTEEVILDLPFSTTNTEALSSIIKRIYNTVFPMSDFLLQLLTKRYIEDNNEYRYIKDSQINKDSYSSLFIWGLLENAGNGKSKYQLQDSKKEKLTRFLRKLLLDFMFDLMHSDVFESSKYYSQMREGLMNDFFFSSIVKKSEYFYYRRLIRTRFSIIYDNSKYVLSPDKPKLLEEDKLKEEHIKCQIETINNSINKLRLNKKPSFSFVNRLKNWLLYYFVKREIKLKKELCSIQEILIQHEITDSHIESTKNNIKNLYAERLDESESAWIETIMSPMAEKHFTFSPDWFENQKTRKKRREFCVSDSWFVDPEEEMARVVFPLEENDEEKSSWKRFLSEIKRLLSSNNTDQRIHYLNSFALSELIGSTDNSSVLARNSSISRWFFRRFDFKDAFRLHLFNGWNDIFSIMLLLFPVILISFPFLWSNPQYIAGFPAVLLLVCFITAIGFTINSARQRQSRQIDDVLLIIRRKEERGRAFRLCAFFLCCGAFLFFFECALWIMLIVGFVCGVLFILFIINKNHRSCDSLHLFLPRLVASITAAWVMLVIGNDLVKEHLSMPACLIISIAVFVFIRYEINNTLPNITKKGILFRSFELMLISFSIALFIGVFAIDVLSLTLVNDASANKIPIECETWHFLSMEEGYTLKIYPTYLIRFSFLAMFIGVFIQMIFEEKNITEM